MYSKLNFCYELISLISKNSNNDDIAQWASDVYLDNLHMHNKDQDLLNMLDNLRYISEPGFEISKKRMLQMCNILLNKYIDEMK